MYLSKVYIKQPIGKANTAAAAMVDSGGQLHAMIAKRTTGDRNAVPTMASRMSTKFVTENNFHAISI
jgi:hypothetical protein